MHPQVLPLDHHLSLGVDMRLAQHPLPFLATLLHRLRLSLLRVDIQKMLFVF